MSERQAGQVAGASLLVRNAASTVFLLHRQSIAISFPRDVLKEIGAVFYGDVDEPSCKLIVRLLSAGGRSCHSPLTNPLRAKTTSQPFRPVPFELMAG